MRTARRRAASLARAGSWPRFEYLTAADYAARSEESREKVKAASAADATASEGDETSEGARQAAAKKARWEAKRMGGNKLASGVLSAGKKLGRLFRRAKKLFL